MNFTEARLYLEGVSCLAGGFNTDEVDDGHGSSWCSCCLRSRTLRISDVYVFEHTVTIAMTMAVAVGVVGEDCGLVKAAPRAATENRLPESTQILLLRACTAVDVCILVRKDMSAVMLSLKLGEGCQSGPLFLSVSLFFCRWLFLITICKAERHYGITFHSRLRSR